MNACEIKKQLFIYLSINIYLINYWSINLKMYMQNNIENTIHLIL